MQAEEARGQVAEVAAGPVAQGVAGSHANGDARTGGRTSRRRPPGDSASRQRVLDAAVKCILEQGLYRASSNTIAEQAGLSWGVIQYYFGTREVLMLAVLEEGARRLTEAVRDAEITGGTIAERVECYMEIIDGYYGSPDYLVFTQVLISLSHDPRTSADTHRHLERVSAVTQPPLRRLQAQVLAGTGIQDAAVESLLFHSLRGLALSHVMLGTIPSVDLPLASREFPAQRKLLAEALALLITAKAGPSSLRRLRDVANKCSRFPLPWLLNQQTFR